MIFSISILLCSATVYVVSAGELSCHLHRDNSYDGTVTITYGREGLSVYKFNNTKLINFLLRNVQVKFSGQLINDKRTKFDIAGLKSDVEGKGNLEGNETQLSLTKCHFSLRKNAKFVKNIDLSIQVKILEQVDECIKLQLCPSLGDVQQIDYIRAKTDRYDFGENSIMFDVFAEKYPNLNLLNVNSEHATINLLADFWLSSLITQVSSKQRGQIALPDVNEVLPAPIINQGYFKLSDGSFGNLQNLTRTKGIIISHKGLEFSLAGEYTIPEVHIRFNKYALKYGLLNFNGGIDIKFNGVIFYAKITVNYNSVPCQIVLSAIKSNVGTIKFELSGNGIFDSAINKVTTDIANRFIPNLISFVEAKIKKGIKDSLGNVNCEKYRP